MLFHSIVPALMEKIFGKAQFQGNIDRKAEAVKRNDYYAAEFFDYTYESIAKWASDPDKLPVMSLGIVRKIINNLAMVYIEAAKRSINGSKKDQELFDNIAKECLIDAVMKQASRYTKLHKTCLLRIVWRNDQIDLDLLTPDILDVSVGDSPRDLKKVLITHEPESGKAEDIEYSLWTPETWSRLDWQCNVIEGQDNPYKVLPFVPLWDGLPLESFWIKGGQDLSLAQDQINEKLSDLCYVIRSQGFGTGWIKSVNHGGQGLAPVDSIQVDPGNLIQLPNDPDAGIGYESPNAPILETWQVIEAIIKQVAVSHSLSAHSLTSTPTEESGKARIVANKELMEQRQDDLLLWRRYEGQLFDLIRLVNNTHSKQKISESAEFTVDFADLKDVSEEIDSASKWQLLIDAGQASPIDWAISRNPDLSREQAKEYLATVREENAELTSAKDKEFNFDN